MFELPLDNVALHTQFYFYFYFLFLFLRFIFIFLQGPKLLLLSFPFNCCGNMVWQHGGNGLMVYLLLHPLLSGHGYCLMLSSCSFLFFLLKFIPQEYKVNEILQICHRYYMKMLQSGDQRHRFKKGLYGNKLTQLVVLPFPYQRGIEGKLL